MTVTLVLGGVRSGKSRHAEGLLGSRPAVYVAPGRAADGTDPDWDRRVQEHRARRCPSWTTEETWDVAAALLRAGRPVLVDCLGTWLTRLVDEAAAWEDLGRASEVVDRAREGLVQALAGCAEDVVVVTNEVGLGVVPERASGRWFRDELGRTNAAVGALADRVHLVVAGRVLDLTGAPLVADRPPLPSTEDGPVADTPGTARRA